MNFSMIMLNLSIKVLKNGLTYQTIVKIPIDMNKKKTWFFQR